MNGGETPRPLIFWGTIHTHADDLPGQTDMVSSLHVHDFVPGNPVTLLGSEVVFDSTRAGSPILYGICGLAVGDLCPDMTENDFEEELVVTTLNGDLAVFNLVPSGSAPGVAIGDLEHYEILDGAVGASNSIVIEDLDAQAPGVEMYVATNFGVRKYVRL